MLFTFHVCSYTFCFLLNKPKEILVNAYRYFRCYKKLVFLTEIN